MKRMQLPPEIQEESATKVLVSRYDFDWTLSFLPPSSTKRHNTNLFLSTLMYIEVYIAYHMMINAKYTIIFSHLSRMVMIGIARSLLSIEISFIFSIIILCYCSRCFSSTFISVGRSQEQVLIPAMFVFGDSLVDDGNNNHLASLAKANFIPYGIDFYQGPTGRFCNGRTIVDFLGELLGLPEILAYANVDTTEMMLRGVNYASAAAGILDESGQNLGVRYSLSQQILNFEGNLEQLRNQMDEKKLSQYLAKSIVVIVIGSNDYINNYLMPTIYTSSYYYNPDEYADLLINHFTRHILALHNSGLRKFFLAGVGPLGCIPSQLANGRAPPGQCISYVNEIVGLFNGRLRSLVDRMNANNSGAVFVYGNTYGAVGDIINNPANYGFQVTDRGCCGLGRNQAQITCLFLSIPCTNRKEYVFWDAFHPTEAANGILAQRTYSGSPSDCHPINVQHMAQI